MCVFFPLLVCACANIQEQCIMSESFQDPYQHHIPVPYHWPETDTYHQFNGFSGTDPTHFPVTTGSELYPDTDHYSLSNGTHHFPISNGTGHYPVSNGSEHFPVTNASGPYQLSNSTGHYSAESSRSYSPLVYYPENSNSPVPYLSSKPASSPGPRSSTPNRNSSHEGRQELQCTHCAYKTCRAFNLDRHLKVHSKHTPAPDKW